MLIRNVPNDVDDLELLGVIWEQNPEILVSNECWNESRVRFVLKKFQHVRTVVIELHPKIRKNVNAVGSLKIMWNMCRIEDLVAENAILDSLNNCIQPDSLELCVQDVQELITSAAEKSIPLKKSGYHKVPCWSAELFCMHKQLNAARRRYQRTKNSVLKKVYREIYTLKLG
ncbi:hypothetical protein TNIN_94771 [Trichonephila inaurata madagascariensis]|uniref:Uncharacterized protein n=1 Tax=Trichonephila inaurata madagascariensis TaxID=2747483 RepID=A0A8X6X420_9ARAC|nr:hypothetical protein TNIN_94771 [Trichonephila inaurata madagascariensis]